jgi:hypothetical protein
MSEIDLELSALVPPKLKHVNNGVCPKCVEIKNRYPNFNSRLWDWFKEFQSRHPEAHVSCAGRGELDQEAAYKRGASRAHFGQSAHSWGAALDIFEMSNDSKDIYERPWFDKVLSKNIPAWITWYGAKGSKFFELPHVQIATWREMAKAGQLHLVNS